MAKDSKNVSDMDCKFFETSDDVPDHRDLDSEKKNLMIFDDLQSVGKAKQMRYVLY